MRVAIVHDWLTGIRGGEKVLESLCRMLPGADVFTLIHVPQNTGSLVAGHRIITSPLNRLPGVRRYYRYLLPWMPRAIESFDLREYGLIVSSSHAVAKGVQAPRGARHICYCHTPMRYAWDTGADYFRFGRLSRFQKYALGAWKHRLRTWDLRANSRVTQFVTNSENVRERIARFYGCDATVIYPPVDTNFFTPAPAGRVGGYFLVVSALEPYKRVDIAVRALSSSGHRVVIAGVGSQSRALRRIAARNVEFAGWVSNERLRELYRGCRALLFPGVEDFGIVPVEAQACGKPVIAYGQGGVVESVISARTGIFFFEQTEQSLLHAIGALDQLHFDPSAARANSLRFSRERFEQDFGAVLGRRAHAVRTA